MAFTRHAIYGDASAWHDAPLVGLSGRIEHNLGSQSLADEKGRLGSVPLSFKSNQPPNPETGVVPPGGFFSVDLPATDDATVVEQVTGTLQYRVLLSFTDPGGGGRRNWDSGWFSLTADVNVFTVDGAVSAEAAASGAAFLAEMEAIRDAALAPTEAQVRTVVTTDIPNPASEIGAALSETIGTEATVVAHTARGMSMQAYEHATARGIRVLHQDGSTLYGSTDTGAIRKSVDQGVTWTAPGGTVPTIDGLYVLGTGTLLAHSNTTGRLWRSTDDGATWTQVKTLTDRILGSQGIVEAPDGSVLHGDYGTNAATSYQIWRSTDDGVTWTSVFTPPSTPSATQVHSIVYDPIEDTLVAFIDGSPPRHYRSDDNGVTWTLIGVADQREHPNWVAPMFFDTHIAWGYDSEFGGMIARLSREDYYAGAWTGNVEQITHVNGKAWYYTFPVRPGVWAVSLVDEVVLSGVYTNPREGGSYAQEVYLVYDNAGKVAGGVSWVDLNTPPGTLSSNKIRFPAYRPGYEGDSGVLWLSILPFDGNAWSSVPATAGWGDPLRQINAGRRVTQLALDNGEQVYALDTGGLRRVVLRYDSSNRLIITNTYAGNSLGEVRLSQTGTIDLTYGGVVVAQVRSGLLRIGAGLPVEFGPAGPRVLGGAGDPTGTVSATVGSLYLRSDGGAGTSLYVKESGGSGTSGWVAK